MYHINMYHFLALARELEVGKSEPVWYRFPGTIRVFAIPLQFQLIIFHF